MNISISISGEFADFSSLDANIAVMRELGFKLDSVSAYEQHNFRLEPGVAVDATTEDPFTDAEAPVDKAAEKKAKAAAKRKTKAAEKKAKKEAEEAAKAEEAALLEDDPAVTLDQLKGAVREFMVDHELDDVKTLFASYGAEKISEVDEKNWPALLADLTA